MMKRYHHEPYNGIRENPEGELVEWEDHVVEITQLKELNREMVAIFYRIIDLSWYGETSWSDSPIRECCTAMIAKAEEGG